MKQEKQDPAHEDPKNSIQDKKSSTHIKNQGSKVDKETASQHGRDDIINENGQPRPRSATKS